MVIVEINSVLYGSTGKIMQQIRDNINKFQHTVKICIPKGRHNVYIKEKDIIYIGNKISEDTHLILDRLTGFNGCFSFFATIIFLRKLRKLNPDLIHLHNLHNCYINLPMLFKYIKKNNLPVIWTFHDCWAFTGHCPHFEMVKCNKWRTLCCNCSQYKSYPKSFFDNSKKLYRLKKKWFTDIPNLTIVTPSQWLSDLVKQSFLKNYPVKVINNGIDLSVFKPNHGNFRERYNISKDKHIVLGVAFGWGKRKGLDVFIELAKRIDEKYQIVLVGTNKTIDEQLPNNIISIHRTYDQSELSEIYTEADVFVNPTREEVFGLVNVEALACGTPGITFRSGGSPECFDGTCGSIVECDDTYSMEREIIRICEDKPYSKESCIKRAANFNMNDKLKEYIELYEQCKN